MTFVFAAILALKLLPLDETAYAKMIAANQGKVVAVDFWATWCDPCRAELPALAALQKKLHGRGFVLVTVSADELDSEVPARTLLRKSGISGRAFIKQARNDDDFINAIDRKWSGALPALFIYDKQGRLQKSMIGETPVSEIEAAVAPLL